MTDEELLRKVGAALGEEAAPESDPVLDDPRWDRLAAGELDEAEQEALRRLAVETWGSDEVYRAFSHVEEAQHRRIEALFDPLPLAADEPRKLDEPDGGGAKVIPFPRRWHLMAVAAPVLAAAAALLLVLLPSGPTALPAYTLELEGGERSTRAAAPGPEAGPSELTPDSLVSVVLRPATGVEGRITVRGFLVGPQGGAEETAVALTLPVEAHTGGTLTVAGTAGELFSARPGVYTLALLVARADDPAPAAADVPGWVSAPPAGLGERWFVRTVRLVPE